MLFIKELLKQSDILKAKQKIKDKDQANTIQRQRIKSMAKRDISNAKINQWSHNRLNRVALKYLLKKSAEKTNTIVEEIIIANSATVFNMCQVLF